MSMLPTRSLPAALPTSALNAAPDTRPANLLASPEAPSFASLIGARLSGGNTAPQPAGPAGMSSAAPKPLQPQSPAPAPAPSAQGSDSNGHGDNRTQDNNANAARARERTAERSAAARAAQSGRPPHAGPAQTPPKTGTADIDAEAAKGSGRDPSTATATSDDGAVQTTSLAEWLAGLTPQTLPAEIGKAAAQGRGDEAASTCVDTTEAAPGGDAGRRSAGAGRRVLGANAEAGDSRAGTGSLQQLGRFELDTGAKAQPLAAAQLQTAVAEPRSVPPASQDKPTGDAAAAVLGLASPAHEAAPVAAPEATTVQLPTPTHDADFPDVLATRVSVLVKDGVQKAELHLNPAEMGPISVQIAVDAGQAQIDFTAAAGATRHLIETSLPMLAAALHSAGLTLSGGGVFQQTPEQGSGARQDGEPGSRARTGTGGGGDTVAAPRAARLVQPRGVVDLYA